MKILLTNTCKPIPILIGKYLSVDDVSYRYIVDQDVFDATAYVPSFPLHFLAQNLNVPSVVWEWPTFENLEEELRSDHYDYVGINFKLIDLDRVEEMIAFLRRVSPDTKIILGGYGTIGFDEPEFAHIGKSADYVCTHGDGARFLQTLLGDFGKRPTIAHLPSSIVTMPCFSVDTYIPYLISSLGCAWKCEFCSTAAYTEGRVVDVMTAGELFESMKWHYKQYPHLGEVRIMDEEFLLRKRKVGDLGRLIRNDDEFGLRKMNYFGFGTIKALSLWEPEELVLNGVNVIWTGIESIYSYHRKKGDVDQKALIHSLQEVGIETQLSWIVGDDCQTKENIDADVEDLLDHAPCTFQLTSLCAFPGTPLYKRLKAEGRTRPPDPLQYHFYGNSMEALHFTYEERINLIFDIYRRMYETHGPTIMGSLEVFMNGYEYCARSKNPYLNAQRSEFYENKARGYCTLMDVAVEFAPTPQAKQKMVDLRNRYVDVFGPLTKRQQLVSNRFLRLAAEETGRREREGTSRRMDAPSRRYTYAGR